jgi:hypothetical protein
MSAMGGSWVQPPDVTRRVTSTGAPQLGQLRPVPSEGSRQYGQV